MREISIKPFSESFFKIPEKWRPGMHPIFPYDSQHGGAPTEADFARARELIAALDEKSAAWYRKKLPWLFKNTKP